VQVQKLQFAPIVILESFKTHQRAKAVWIVHQGVSLQLGVRRARRVTRVIIPTCLELLHVFHVSLAHIKTSVVQLLVCRVQLVSFHWAWQHLANCVDLENIPLKFHHLIAQAANKARTITRTPRHLVNSALQVSTKLFKHQLIVRNVQKESSQSPPAWTRAMTIVVLVLAFGLIVSRLLLGWKNVC
jgi:hypothetical protein